MIDKLRLMAWKLILKIYDNKNLQATIPNTEYDRSKTTG
jgi:hypothetical protein